MQIDFVEEFPSAATLHRLQLIDFEATIYLAARSFRRFQHLRRHLARTQPHLEAAYWPLLPVSYWISPFTYPAELAALHADLQQARPDALKVLLDLELPLLTKHLFARNALAFRGNKRRIRRLLTLCRARKIQVFTAELPAPNPLVHRAYELFGVSYPPTQYPHTKIVMYYSSLIPRAVDPRRIRDAIRASAHRYGGALQVGLGPIAPGVWGTEPLLSPRQLARDLAFLARHRIQTAVIFRVGGLTREYMKVMTPYLS